MQQYLQSCDFCCTFAADLKNYEKTRLHTKGSFPEIWCHWDRDRAKGVLYC